MTDQMAQGLTNKYLTLESDWENFLNRIAKGQQGGGQHKSRTLPAVGK